MTPTYYQGSDLPALGVSWRDSTGALVDFSSGYTFVVKVGVAPNAAFTKTSGTTGAGSDPNVTINWATVGELNTLTPGTYTVQITATRTADSRDRIMQTTLIVAPALF